MAKTDISKDELLKLITSSEAKLEKDITDVWENIKVEPEIWKLEDNEFWIVAIMDAEVIWYNHKSKGFNVSAFKNSGIIDEYWEEECDLNDLLWHLF